jgi:hypothetical protein
MAEGENFLGRGPALTVILYEGDGRGGSLLTTTRESWSVRTHGARVVGETAPTTIDDRLEAAPGIRQRWVAAYPGARAVGLTRPMAAAPWVAGDPGENTPFLPLVRSSAPSSAHRPSPLSPIRPPLLSDPSRPSLIPMTAAAGEGSRRPAGNLRRSPLSVSTCGRVRTATEGVS